MFAKKLRSVFERVGELAKQVFTLSRLVGMLFDKCWLLDTPVMRQRC
jgi:hypothetical protein